MTRTLPVVDPTNSGHPTPLTQDVTSRDRDATRRWFVAAIASLFLIAVAHVFDAWAWAHVRYPQVYEQDWGRLLRSLGFLPTWCIVALALCLHDRPRPAWGWRGGLMLLVPTVTGALAEVLKLLVRRQRPGDLSPDYLFRPFSVDPWSNRGLGMPSSHAMVAFGAATVLARLFPRAWWVWYLIAAGCAWTRVLARAHYLSDTVAAAVLAWLAADIVIRWGLRRRAMTIGRAAAEGVAPR